MSGTGPPLRQTIPSADLAFVDPKSGRLTLWAYQFLARVGLGVNATIDNVTTITSAANFPLGGVTAIPASGQAEASLLGAPREAPLDIVTLHNGARLLDGTGSPEGQVPGFIGDVFLRRDGSAAGTLYTKVGGEGDAIGWVPGTGGEGGYLPLVNGDTFGVSLMVDHLGQQQLVEAPRPALMVDPLGQTIGVPV